jgi:chromosome segregation ATPase
MSLITDMKQLLAHDKEKAELREQVRVLTNRVATLEIQGGRIKEERDKAREERDGARFHLQRIRDSIVIMT